MKTILTSLATILLNISLQAQIVNISDAKFKTYLVGNSLINTNGDSEIDATEAAVFTGTINVNFIGVLDLTGIEAFTALEVLECSFNKLTSLDVSKNIALKRLDCHYNTLLNLDVASNSVLSDLACSYNKLTTLDVSKNKVLLWLYCDNNTLTSLNVSKNTVLKFLYCHANSLISLDISNGNNVNMSGSNFANNPALYCIQVDNETWANANWSSSSIKDPHVLYSNDCKTIGIEDISLDEATITCHSNIITINGTIGTMTVFSLLGQQVHQSQLISGTNNIIIDGSGVYLVMVQTVKGVITKKVHLN